MAETLAIEQIAAKYFDRLGHGGDLGRAFPLVQVQRVVEISSGEPEHAVLQSQQRRQQRDAHQQKRTAQCDDGNYRECCQRDHEIPFVPFDHAARPADLLLVRTGQGTQALIERGPDIAVRVVVAERACRGGAFFPTESHEFSAEAHELVDASSELVDVRLLRGDRVRFPGARHFLQFGERWEQVAREFLGCIPVRRHVDAARLHDDVIDEAIDALEVDGAARCPIQRRVVLRGVVRRYQSGDHAEDWQQG
jgi:hypothetical protein